MHNLVCKHWFRYCNRLCLSLKEDSLWTEVTMVSRLLCQYWLSVRSVWKLISHSVFQPLEPWSGQEAFEWSPHSPDLNPCDFFLWGHLKDCIYRNKPTTLQQLKENILQYSREIDQHLCERVIQSFKKRMQVCAQRKDHHLEHVIWILSMSAIFLMIFFFNLVVFILFYYVQ